MRVSALGIGTRKIARGLPGRAGWRRMWVYLLLVRRCVANSTGAFLWLDMLIPNKYLCSPTIYFQESENFKSRGANFEADADNQPTVPRPLQGVLPEGTGRQCSKLYAFKNCHRILKPQVRSNKSTIARISARKPCRWPRILTASRRWSRKESPDAVPNSTLLFSSQ